MSAQMEGMLQRRHDDRDKGAIWVFPNKRKTGPLQEPRKQIERLEQITGVKFSCHDLRRTFATLAEAHGIDHHSIKRALNHKTQDITDRYIQVRAEKMRNTFEAIAQEIVWWVYEEPPATEGEST
jgi:integrase